MAKQIILALAVILAASIFVLWVQHNRIRELASERDRYKGNSEALFVDVARYKVRDSLNAARVQTLELTVKEFERFRAEDAALIRSLTSKNRDLANVNKAQSQTIVELSAVPRDTIIIRDSIRVPAIAVHCGDAWYDFDGLLTADAFTGKMQTRDSLMIVESVRYKRFLWWKTKRILDRRVDCVSKNPHNTILGLEHVVVEK